MAKTSLLKLQVCWCRGKVMHVWCIHISVWVWCPWASYGSQRKKSGVFIYLRPPYCLKTRTVPKPEATNWPKNSGGALVSALLSVGVTGIHSQAWLFTCMLRTQTQTPVLAKQTLLQSESSPLLLGSLYIHSLLAFWIDKIIFHS